MNALLAARPHAESLAAEPPAAATVVAPPAPAPGTTDAAAPGTTMSGEAGDPTGGSSPATAARAILFVDALRLAGGAADATPAAELLPASAQPEPVPPLTSSDLTADTALAAPPSWSAPAAPRRAAGHEDGRAAVDDGAVPADPMRAALPPAFAFAHAGRPPAEADRSTAAASPTAEGVRLGTGAVTAARISDVETAQAPRFSAAAMATNAAAAPANRGTEAASARRALGTAPLAPQRAGADDLGADLQGPAKVAPLAAGAEAAPAPSTQIERRDAPLRLPNGDPANWRQPLADALGERLQVRLGRGTEHAVIRLDPPMMGSIEILVRHEAGNVQVQLTATHGEVLRQLHGIAEGLRQDLSARQYAEVSVHVADGSRDSGGRQRHGSDGGRDGDDAPGRALAETDAKDASPFTLA